MRCGKYLYVTAAMFLIVAAPIAPAFAAADLNPVSTCEPGPGLANYATFPCNEPGATKLESDSTDVIACLNTSATDPTLVWKSEYGGASVGWVSYTGGDGNPSTADAACKAAGYTAATGACRYRDPAGIAQGALVGDDQDVYWCARIQGGPTVKGLFGMTSILCAK